ncbi:MAG TPA: molybdenum cofactor guanylyltransferase [Terriglobales bacterium]|jgi:molybdopterin-guanine dinucleotide biosynthesis protein A
MRDDTITLTAVLFAGGESRRMGTDKALLSLNGKPLWSRQLETLRELVPEEILISARTPPAWCPPEITVVLDDQPSRGPLSGLSAVLHQLRTTHLLALAIDLPQMTARHLQSLRKLASPGQGVIPRNGDFCEPLCAIYPAAIAMMTAAALAKEELSLQALVKELLEKSYLREYVLAGPERRLYRNVNTPEDLAIRA